MKKIAALLLLSLCLVSCESVYFYGQAIRGQLSILGKRRNIERMVEDPSTDPVLKTRLERILSIREFALTDLHLPVENNFSTYVDLQRPFVVWNVFASPEFSMSARQWCYPVAGCVSYRGYFSEEAATKYARSLSKEGEDVYVGGVAAYSTLGWFSDSVLSTVINREEYRLAALIFHELAHQMVYIPGDTEFNESFATTVETEGLKRWLEKNQGSGEAEAMVEQAREERKYREEFVALVSGTIEKLKQLYESGVGEEKMRAGKQSLIAALREDYQRLKQDWNGYDAYDGWFSGPLNNAQLGTVATYFNKVPAFEMILEDEDYDFPRFYERVEALSELPAEERNRALKRLTP